MHPRNILFINPPNFDQLAVKYERLRKVCKLNKKGKFQVNFQESESTKILTEVLLHEYFSLNVSFNKDHLIPRINGRLDYLLIIEDFIKQNFKCHENVLGIDIGVGANCIYPLLGVKEMKWNFIGIDIDDVAIEEGKKIVKDNNLTSKITLIKTSENEKNNIYEEALKYLEQNNNIIFSMSNPPFFEESEVNKKFINIKNGERTKINGALSSRKTPSSTTIAKDNELYTTGGEVDFIKNMIENSKNASHKISLFTSLIGKKTSITSIEDKLKSIDECQYKFYQMIHGKTSRWIVMWTFNKSYIFPTENCRKRKIK
uniref:U6 small nuclear RNA (adenine-(43)-N(6))-methyltransferase n=1 Tax=Parastrongyloides trichosuri TaxID=131310 RepID=A0A0N4ZQD5_PARTI